ncbi:hypothetical protein JCGZ_26179 [Jatropha curcas]|uniref:DUF4378 domain-containing protein n=2 Tax=Jatropha curcas TaxID=180498 RepID=A0A067JHT1_JATCU|nr:hypothetical protein JCGZ_26179 [Jatropha curcas]
MGLDLLPDQAYSPISSSSNLGTPNNPVGKSHLNHHLRRRQPLQSKTSSHRNSLDGDHFSGTRSLPETPRISSARRSDVEHRLSLQINKENLSPGEEMILSRISSLKRKELKIEEENRSPGHYARQIVKQVKESVSRKVGLDITNTVRNKQEVVNQLKSKKMTKILTTVAQDSKTGKQTAASCSPRLKFLESRHKPISNVLSDKDHNNISQPSVSGNSQVKIMSQKSKAPTTKPKLQAVQEQEQHHRPIKKCKKVTEERFGPPKLKKPPQTSDIIRNKQEEPFVSPTVTRPNIPDKKCKKTPLSNDLLNITVPTLLPVKKDPMPPATKIPQKPAPKAQETKRSSQLSSCSSHSYKQREAMHATFNALDSNNRDSFNGAVAAVVTTTTTTTTTGDGAAAAEAEYEYITRILRRTGIDKDTPVSFTRWFSPSHPLDPSIFYRLEYFTTLSPSATTTSEKYICGELTLRCNRKLLFHLIDEILVEILKPYLNMKPWASSLSERCDFNMHGSNLIDLLCSKVRSFPCADCRLLEDIDALVDKDMPVLKGQTEVAFGEEGEGIVNEIEKDLLETLIHETAVIFYGGGNGK